MNKNPNFFIVGAPKCGTTSLHYYLSWHPEIYFSPIKEPVFFAKDIVERVKNCKSRKVYFLTDSYFSKQKPFQRHIAYIQDFNLYLKLFSYVKNEKAIGEASACYLFSSVAAREIYKFNKEAKIVIILRNPVDRAFSHYLMNLRDGIITNKNFLDEVFSDYEKQNSRCKEYYVGMGLYFEQLKRYFNLFSENNIKVLIFENFVKNIPETCKGLFSFLGVKDNFEVNFSEKKNESFSPKFPEINSKIKNIKKKIANTFPFRTPKILKDVYNSIFMERNKPMLTIQQREVLLSIFKEDIIKTQSLLKIDLSFWFDD